MDQVRDPQLPVLKKHPPCSGEGHVLGRVVASRGCEGPQVTVNKTTGPPPTTEGGEYCQEPEQDPKLPSRRRPD